MKINKPIVFVSFNVYLTKTERAKVIASAFILIFKKIILTALFYYNHISMNTLSNDNKRNWFSESP